MHHPKRSPKTQRGNILFIILLAVVLFVALTNAVMRGINEGGKDSSDESADAAAAEILQWFTAVDNAVMRMNLVGGIAYEDMSFGYDAKYYGGADLLNYQHNSRCTSNKCRVFHAEGGGVAPPNFTKYATPNPTNFTSGYLAPGFMISEAMKWPQAGTDTNDVTLRLYAIKPEVCAAVNKALHIEKTPGVSGTSGQAWNISNWDTATRTVVVNADQLTGKESFSGSTAGTDSGRYCPIWHVVIKR